MSGNWDPALYTRFEDERTRPARDLLGRVTAPEVRIAVDLGCGPGNSTALIAERFPAAAVTGLDTSETMLASARARLPGVRFERADIASWVPETPPDLIVANASLQWVDDHERLVPRLFGVLAPGGVLAVQMPDNRDEPSHAAMRALAGQAPWSTHVGEAAATRVRVLPPAAYYDLLAPVAADVWRTIYLHPMDSAAAIVDWVSGTGLRPFIDPLPDDLRASYLAAYEARIAAAYPPRADGRRLLAFPRLFVVARKPA